jgi:long-chain fatty acid transport protein
VGGIGTGGPATADPTAVYWNPAALGGLEGNQALVAGTARLDSVTFAAPGRTAAESRTWTQPVGWPLGPGGFVGLAAVLGQRFTLGFAAYTPFASRLAYAAEGGEPATRYHIRALDLRHIAAVPALSVGLGGGLHLGAAPGFLFSVGRLVFDEDTGLRPGVTCDGAPCGAESPAAAARYDVGSGLDPIESSLAFTFSAGLHLARPTFAVGLALVTRPLGGEGISIRARRNDLTRPPRAGGGPLCAEEQPTPCALGELRYGLPDVLSAGASFRGGPTWEVGVVARWLTFSLHDRIDLRIVGPADGASPDDLPDHVVLHRGFRDVLDVRVRASRRFGDRVQVTPGLRAETSAVPTSHASPAAPDAFKVEPSLAVRVRVWRGVALSAGYAHAFFLPVDGGGAFDPGAASACEAAGGALTAPACAARASGLGRAGAAGRLTQSVQILSLTLSAPL